MAVYLQNAPKLLRASTRSLATISSSSSSNAAPALSTTSVPFMDTIAEHDGPLRPHLKLPVNPNHGLFGFFRLKTNENSHSKLQKGGQPEYVAVESPLQINHSGRAWNTSELRRKSFKDLHTLWYILLRERNLLATQKAERKRLTVHTMLSPIYSEQVRKCNESMARIKGVITERRNAYIQAARLRRALRRNPELLRSPEVTDDSKDAMLEGEAGQTRIVEDDTISTKVTP